MKKFILLICIMFLGLGEIAAMKLDFIFTVAPNIYVWISDFYEAYGEYPADMDDLVNKNPHPKRYNTAFMYQRYIDSGFDIIYNKNLLILIVRHEVYGKSTCVCDIKTKMFYYYDENNHLVEVNRFGE